MPCEPAGAEVSQKLEFMGACWAPGFVVFIRNLGPQQPPRAVDTHLPRQVESLGFQRPSKNLTQRKPLCHLGMLELTGA